MDQKVFLRGDYHSLGDPVERTVPAILRLSAPAPNVKTKSGRLELADWIVDPRNPLPAARDGEPHLAGTLRRWHRAHAG